MQQLFDLSAGPLSALVAALVLTAAVPAVVRGRGATRWLEAALHAIAATVVAVVVLGRGEVVGTLVAAPPWLLVAVTLVLAAHVGQLVAGSRPRVAPWAAGAAAVTAVPLAVVGADLATPVLVVAWLLLHVATSARLRRRAVSLAGSVLEARLRAASLGVAVLALAPMTTVAQGPAADLLTLLLVIGVAVVGLALVGTGVSRQGGVLRDVGRMLDRLQDPEEDGQELLEVLGHRFGARSVSLVDHGGLVLSDARGEVRRRLGAAAALSPDADGLRRLDGTLLLGVPTGRGELLLDVTDVADLLGPADHELLAWVGERIGLALDRGEARERDRRAVAALRAAHVMRDDFLATLSHELRTPLTSIRGFSEVLFDTGERLDPVQRRDMLDRIRANAGDLERMIAGLLDLTTVRGRSGPSRVGTYDLSDLVERAVAACRAELLDHHVRSLVDPVALETDGGALLSILDELLGNAVKFTPAGTTVTVRGRQEGQHVVLEVADEGPGVPPEIRGRVFEPFVRGGEVLTRSTRGVGIGLALVAELTRQLGGTVTLADDLHGACVRVTLPLVPESPHVPIHEDLPPPPRVRA